MSYENHFFETALSNFALDAACGGAVRHLTKLGYTLDQIVDRLDYPAPRAKVRRIMMEYLYESRVLLREEPSEALLAAPAAYVQEQDAYGRRSIRRIDSDRRSQFGMTSVPDLSSVSDYVQERKIRHPEDILWKETRYVPERDRKLTVMLHQKCEENGEMYSYISCQFGNLQCLNKRQRDYLEGLCFDAPIVYHRLDQRMREIIPKLYEAGEYHGSAYFIRTRERMEL